MSHPVLLIRSAVRSRAGHGDARSPPQAVIRREQQRAQRDYALDGTREPYVARKTLLIY